MIGEKYKNSELEMLFAKKLTENGDTAFNTTGNKLLNILFMSEYYTGHLNEVEIGTSGVEKLFAMFIRDPRNGLGKRELGRVLMHKSGLDPHNIVACGRYDDLYLYPHNKGIKCCQSGRQAFTFKYDIVPDHFSFLADNIHLNYLGAKKWAPRFSSQFKQAAHDLATFMHLDKQAYSHLISLSSVETHLTQKSTDKINFEHVPSLAMMKYHDRFSRGEDTKERFGKYIEDVKSGKKSLKVNTSTVYDIYRNCEKIDADLYFAQIKKISGSWIPVVDTSGSMENSFDALGKAMSVGHYLAKCSTYCPNQVVTFSSNPHLINLGVYDEVQSYAFSRRRSTYQKYIKQHPEMANSQYIKEVLSMYTGDCSNTNLSKVMKILMNLKNDFPEYLVVMSDMEFDYGSSQSKDELMDAWRKNGIETKIVWWNFNERSKTCPETDSYGNIFMSGYSPWLLEFLNVGFDGNKFLENMLVEYANKMDIDINKLEEL